MSGNVKKDSSGGFGQQDSLQAVVFTDDFVHDLKPADVVYPSTLLPIITCPLLDYLLETLARSKVQQVFLYCSSHIDKLKSYINSLKSLHDKSMVITTIVSDGCRSLGDALRDMDTKGCIRGDFILIRGTAFTNVDLRVYMDLHKARKEKDKNVAMTMLFRNMGNLKNSALRHEASFVVSSASSKKLLYYKRCDPEEKKVEMELQWFLENDKVNIYSSLFDTRIYMCSQSVLPLFADNFDFQTMEDFIKNVLINEEFLDTRIYWEPLISPAYALPISSWKAYQILCCDILQRLCYPLAPDTLPLSLRKFVYMSRGTYKHNTSTVSKGCVLHRDSIIGKNSTLGKNSSIKKSVIGSQCTIGANVHICNSFLLSDVTIQDDCVINDSIIFSNCTIEKGRKLNACILLPNINCTNDFSNSYIELNSDGKNVPKKLEELQDDDKNNISSILAEDDCELDFDDASSTSSASSAWSSPSTRDSPVPPELQDDMKLFLREVLESLLRGYQDKLNCENLVLEINSSRYAYNASIRQVSYNVIKAILNLPLQHYNSLKNTNSETKIPPIEYFKILKTVLVYSRPIMEHYIKTDISQEDCLRAIQDVTYVHRELTIPYVQFLLKYLYDYDILKETKIIEWFEQDCCVGEDAHHFADSDEDDDAKKKQDTAAAIKTAITPFVKWLIEADEEDSSDDEEDSS